MRRVFRWAHWRCNGRLRGCKPCDSGGAQTRYLFRINKGISNSWDNEAINAYMPDADRPVPLGRMIFIGDDDTDIPSMKMMTLQGGYSIAAYDPVGPVPHAVARPVDSGDKGENAAGWLGYGSSCCAYQFARSTRNMLISVAFLIDSDHWRGGVPWPNLRRITLTTVGGVGSAQPASNRCKPG